MVTVDGKETIYSASFLMESDSKAVVEVPAFPRSKFFFEAIPNVADEQAEREAELFFRGNDLIINLPYLRKVNACTDPFATIGNLLGANVTACITRQATNGRMLVNFEIYVDAETQ